MKRVVIQELLYSLEISGTLYYIWEDASQRCEFVCQFRPVQTGFVRTRFEVFVLNAIGHEKKPQASVEFFAQATLHSLLFICNSVSLLNAKFLSIFKG